ncbi:HsdM family class I SAM-dependent methyltransferase [Halocola ammonii]
MTVDYREKTKELIDDLKSVCANYGLGNDGNEYKIIVQMFQYKLMNDKFVGDVKRNRPELADADNLHETLENMSSSDYEMLLMELGENVAVLKPKHLLSYLASRQNEDEFHKTLDDTLRDIAATNSDIFSVKTQGGSRIPLFDRLSEYINDTSRRDNFCKAIIGKLTPFSFEHIFEEKFDFYATIFEYLIKDYNKDGGGKYAEYYTPHAVAKIMARCLVTDKSGNKKLYDPAAGTGQLLMNLAHQIGEDRCSIFSQDISQKSSTMLRLNLILNNLVHSIPNIIEGNTVLKPYHSKDWPEHFDYIVSNPPFKLDFSEYRDSLDSKTNQERFFAGIPKVPGKAKDKMAIYLLFIQHIMHSLNETGKAAIVVPTGFITAQSGIDKKIRQKLVEERMLAGVVSMPSNIFATTGTNVSILFLDKTNKEDVVLVDASNLGKKVKDGKNQKTLLSNEEEDRIIEVFNSKRAEDDFSVVVPYEELKAKNYSLSAGQYFEVKIEYVDISPKEFEEKMDGYKERLDKLFAESKNLDSNIQNSLQKLTYG